jgi:hypothetical protein
MVAREIKSIDDEWLRKGSERALDAILMLLNRGNPDAVREAHPENYQGEPGQREEGVLGRGYEKFEG